VVQINIILFVDNYIEISLFSNANLLSEAYRGHSLHGSAISISIFNLQIRMLNQGILSSFRQSDCHAILLHAKTAQSLIEGLKTTSITHLY